MPRKQGITGDRVKRKCSCCKEVQYGVEDVNPAIHPLVNKEAAQLCPLCLDLRLFELRYKTEHECIA